MVANSHRFEQVALAAGYFKTSWREPYSITDFATCERLGWFQQKLYLTLDPDAKATPSRRALMANVEDLGNGVYRPREGIDWRVVFAGSWTITAIVSDADWLCQLLEHFCLPFVPTASSLRAPPFPELLPILQLHPDAIIVAMNESRSARVIGTGVEYAQVVSAVANGLSRITPPASAMAIHDYPAAALKSAEKIGAALLALRHKGNQSAPKHRSNSIKPTVSEKVESPSKAEPVLALPDVLPTKASSGAHDSAQRRPGKRKKTNDPSFPGSSNPASPGVPARPIDLRKWRERFGNNWPSGASNENSLLELVTAYTGSEWLLDANAVPQLRFLRSEELLSATLAMMHIRGEDDQDFVDASYIVVAQFQESDKSICVLLSGENQGAIVMRSLEPDEVLLYQNFADFIEALRQAPAKLLRLINE